MTTPITGEVWGSQQEQARAYILEEAEKPFETLRPVVEDARARLYEALDGVGEAQANVRPDTGEGEDAWCVKEAVRHVIHVETAMALRVRALALGEAPPRSSGGPGGNEDKSLAELVSILHQTRAALLEAVGAVEGSERLDTTTPHAYYGELNCRGWFRLQGLHEEDHTRQIHRLKQLREFQLAAGS